jgi:intracellular sulfur oxidation DsrE/DsrF family protein
MLRRSFLSRFPAAAALFGLQTPQSASTSRPRAWEPAHHDQDEWLADNMAKHRVIFDTWNAERFPDAVQFAGNVFDTNKTEYDVPNKDLAIVICVRHHTTPFAFNDAMWAKYGKIFTKRMNWVDPTTKEAPTTNIHAKRLSTLFGQGLQLAVCNRTTRALVNLISEQTRVKPEDVRKELTSNTLGPSHFVPAGVVAVTRAQERGYANISIG